MKSLLVVFFGLLSFPALSQEEAELIPALRELNTFFESNIGPTAMTCPPEESSRRSRDCTLSPLCEQVQANADRPYLIQTPNGGIPNFVMREAVSGSMVACLNQRRELLQNQTEQRLETRLADADERTRTAVSNFLNLEFENLLSGESSSTEEIMSRIQTLAPAVSDQQILRDLSELASVRYEGNRGSSWQRLLGEQFTPADPVKVRETVTNVRDTMKLWLQRNGRRFGNDSTISLLDSVQISIVTDPENLTDGCERDDVAFFGNGRMVICPRGASLPAGGLFTVVAHELGHAISGCNRSSSLTPENLAAYEQVNQCLADPQRGPGPRRIDWEGVRAAAAGLNPSDAYYVQDFINQASQYGTYACMVNVAQANLPRFNFRPPLDQTEETQADWISTQVMQLYSESLPRAEARQFAFEGLTPSILKRACDLSGNSFVERARAAWTAAGCTGEVQFTADASMQRDAGGDEHLAPHQRFRVHLSTPIFREAMNCSGRSTQCQ